MTSIAGLFAAPRTELLARATALGVDLRPHLAQDELVAALVTAMLERGDRVHADGVLSVLPEGFGFLRLPANDYAPSAVDAYLSPSQVRGLNLADGHRVRGPVRAPRGGERYFALLHVDDVQDAEPTHLRDVTPFAARTPVVAQRPLPLADDGDASVRALQALTPLCHGHRALVHAPEGFARAKLLSRIAAAMARANPDLHVTVCLLEQRPEDLAAVRAELRDANGSIDVVGTCYGDAPDRHAATVDAALRRLMREAEHGDDAALLVDSLTALVRAQSRMGAPSGAWIQPGLDARALRHAQQLFVAARQFAEGGALSVVATAVQGAPGSIDEAVLQELAPAANAEVVVDPELARAGAEAPFDVARSRTRREDDAATPADERARRDRLRDELLTAPKGERVARFVEGTAGRPQG